MRILMVHNEYQQAGGEDSVFANEADLLSRSGHDVARLVVDNRDIAGVDERVKAAGAATYSFHGRRLVAEAIGQHRPDVVHVHNFFPRIGPALFDAAEAAGVPSVWTLHNFRVTCANGLLFRDGRPCEDCVGRLPASAVINRCYRGSVLGSAAVAGSILAHRLLRTWARKVTRFIALSQFAREKFVAAGLPAERIVVKPNFAPDPGPPAAVHRSGFLYVGRLSTEKGVGTLLDAFCQTDCDLSVIGDGPELAILRARAPANVKFAGRKTGEAVSEALARATALIVPSVSYENFPMVVAEAFATATPVIASRLGALPTIVSDGVTGILFEPGSAGALAEAVRYAAGNRHALARMGANARSHYLDALTPDRCLRQLETIYAEAAASQRTVNRPYSLRLAPALR